MNATYKIRKRILYGVEQETLIGAGSTARTITKISSKLFDLPEEYRMLPKKNQITKLCKVLAKRYRTANMVLKNDIYKRFMNSKPRKKHINIEYYHVATYKTQNMSWVFLQNVKLYKI